VPSGCVARILAMLVRTGIVRNPYMKNVLIPIRVR
jgi:hypothetical protein